MVFYRKVNTKDNNIGTNKRYNIYKHFTTSIKKKRYIISKNIINIRLYPQYCKSKQCNVQNPVIVFILQQSSCFQYTFSYVKMNTKLTLKFRIVSRILIQKKLQKKSHKIFT